MIVMKEYRATVNHAFWFDEIKQYIQLVNSGVSAQEIRDEAINNNIFLATTSRRAKQMVGELERRVSSLSADIIKLFPQLDVQNQRIVTMISIMNTNKLIANFMYESYRTELITGDRLIDSREYMAFFNKKQSENLEIAKWTEPTIKRMKGIVKTFLRDAGLVEEREGKDYLKRPQLNSQLRQLLINNGQQVTIDSLTGEH